MDSPSGAVEPIAAPTWRRDVQQSKVSRDKQPEEVLTADQRDVIRMLADMERRNAQRARSPSMTSTDSHTSIEDFDAAVQALAVLEQHVRNTPPILLALDDNHSGLPPTPPTMTSSEVAETKPARTLSPESHVFADRVRNALNQSHRSGFSTPVTEAHSPPTPDHSPPSIRETMAVPRPKLIHAYSSFADSFKTANEGLSSGESTHQLHSPIDEQLPDLNLLGVDLIPEVATPGSDTGTATQTDASENRPVRVKHYQTESESDFDRPTSSHTGDSHEPDMSPTIQQALPHPSGFAFQHRLRAPIKPGDDIKQMDNALLYASSKWQPRVTVPTVAKDLDIERYPTPRREMDTEKLKAALPAHTASPTLIENVTPHLRPRTPVEHPSSPIADPASPQIESIPEPTSPPATATGQAILEGNNATYQFIQRENAKRYSAISDGSGVQVVVVTSPEHKRTLRHTPKRESLRADVSLASNSKRGSLDGGNHKLKYKRAMPSLSDDGDEAGSPKVEPEEFYRRATKPLPIAHASVGPLGLHQSRHEVQHGYRSLSGDTGADYLKGKTALTNSNGPTFAPRRAQTLRRSVRDQALDRVESSGGDGMRGRPWSADPMGKGFGSGSKEEQARPLHKLRRTSAEKRLCNLGEVRRTSLGRLDELRATPKLSRNLYEDGPEQLSANGSMMSRAVNASLSPPKLRRTSVERRLENIGEDRQENTDLSSASADLAPGSHDDYDRDSWREYGKSSDKTLPISPRRKSLDLRHLHPVETPLSFSQTSGTEGELCEARGVEIFPHHNESLLLIHGNERENDQANEEATAPGAPEPMFQAFVQPPDSPNTGVRRSSPSAHSPLTNPRAAPEPPKLVFIPPTPVDELDNQFGDPASSFGPRQHLQRRASLTERVRRYSASLVQPIPFGRSNSARRQPIERPQTSPDNRPTHLNPFWQPRNFWEEYSSSDDDDDDFADDRLPPGGDTSDVQEKRNSFFPRSMSVRLPGFRGRGGFLQGNSLGIDRHGTNNRRHHVTKRTSEEMMQRMVERRRRRTFTLPFTGGTRVEYVGLAALSSRVREAKIRRRERAAEKRRGILREQISPPV